MGRVWERGYFCRQGKHTVKMAAARPFCLKRSNRFHLSALIVSWASSPLWYIAAPNADPKCCPPRIKATPHEIYLNHYSTMVHVQSYMCRGHTFMSLHRRNRCYLEGRNGHLSMGLLCMCSAQSRNLCKPEIAQCIWESL